MCVSMCLRGCVWVCVGVCDCVWVCVCQTVTESSPWKHVPPADRFIDSYNLYNEGSSGDAGMFGALTRGIVDDCRAALKLIAP